MIGKVVLTNRSSSIGMFDSEGDARLYQDNAPDLEDYKIVKLEDPWPTVPRPNLTETLVDEPSTGFKDEGTKTQRATNTRLYLMSKAGVMLGNTDDGYLLIVEGWGDDRKIGILEPIAEGEHTKLKSLKDEEMIPKLTEALFASEAWLLAKER